MAGMEGGIGGPKFDWRGFLKIMLILAAAGIVLIVGAVKLGYAASFYPACLKPDGDWLHGVSRKECISKDIRGRWYTGRILKKAQKVW
jgi:hypothetical protein